MHETILLGKPVTYGSELADRAMIVLLALHAFSGSIAVPSSVVALTARAGTRLHRSTGRVFMFSMLAAALSGSIADLIRLTVSYRANHTIYPGMAVPSSIPARFGFLYVSVCIVLLFATCRSPRRGQILPARERVEDLANSACLFLGVATAALIVAFFNPWTGALWMIGTFATASHVILREPCALIRHRRAMILLAGFSWWAALQGFGPAFAALWRSVESPAVRYRGDLPGNIDIGFFSFLLAWLPPFAGVHLLARRAQRSAVR